MRAVVVGLVAIPIVVAGGLGIAAAVDAIVDPSPAPGRTSATSTATSADATTTEPSAATGTAIEGIRPHLTVVDGRAALMLPGSLPSMLSVLPGHRPIDLEPLPSAGQLRGEPTALDTDRSQTLQHPASRTTGAAGPAGPGGPGGPGAASPHTYSRVRTLPPSPAADGPQADPRRVTGTGANIQPPPSVDPVRNAPDADTGNRPPHADQIGRPPHADQTGPPPHARGADRPSHAGQYGRPSHADQTGRPPHASDTSRDNSGNGDRGNARGGHGNTGGGHGADHNRSSPR